IVWQDIVRIDLSIKKKQFHTNPVILSSIQRANSGSGRLHLLGLISDGGVHSHINYSYAVLQNAKAQNVRETYVHFFGDGRDTAPHSAAGYREDLVGFMKREGYGELATVVGRYYAMDRDKRWKRVSIAVDGSLDDSLNIPVPKDLHITTMSQYNPTFPLPTASPPQSMSNMLAETLSLQSIHLSHIAETEKYAHVTFFFNGGIERAFPNEHRYLIRSPKTPTYDQSPTMSVAGVAQKVADLVRQSE
ncbi:BPG-independent, partial [Lentinula aff. detonsa]